MDPPAKPGDDSKDVSPIPIKPSSPDEDPGIHYRRG